MCSFSGGGGVFWAWGEERRGGHEGGRVGGRPAHESIDATRLGCVQTCTLYLSSGGQPASERAQPRQLIMPQIAFYRDQGYLSKTHNRRRDEFVL